MNRIITGGLSVDVQALLTGGYIGDIEEDPMAAMDKIMLGITREIRELICRIVPDTKASERFHSPKSLQKSPLADKTGKPRLFEVTWDMPKQLDGGCVQKAWTLDGHVTIGYPVTTDWNIAKLSDMQLIFDALNQTDCSQPSCNFRHLPQDGDPESEVAEDDWEWVKIPLRAVVTTV